MAFTRSKHKKGRARRPFLCLERVKGIEPSYAAWEAAVLPLNYTRGRRLLHRDSRALSSRFRTMCERARPAKGREALANQPFFGCFTIRRYGFFSSQPSGNSLAAASLSSEGTMITSSPSFQFTGVATL